MKTDVSGSVSIRQVNPPTFIAVSPSTVIGGNKSMISLFNNSVKLVKVKKINIINVETAAITGIMGEFRLHRINSIVGGSVITPVSFDSSDLLPSGVNVYTSGTVSESSFIKRQFLSTDETAAGGGTDLDQLISYLQLTTPFYSEYDYSKPIVLRQGEGLHVRHATVSTSGTFDLEIIFTVDFTI